MDKYIYFNLNKKYLNANILYGNVANYANNKL